MTTYNFKKDTKVHVVIGGLRYILDVYPDLSFSQTYNETSVPVKTLHSQYNMFENAVINKANPANFSFTSPVLFENDLDVLFRLLLDYDTTSSEATLKTADLYFEANSEVYKIEKCVVESGTFQITMGAPITLNLSGTGRKLTKFTSALPGTLQTRSTIRTFGRVGALDVRVDSVIQASITAVSFEIKNSVTWVDFATLQNSQSVSSASETMFPEAFVVGSRTLSGTVQQYVTDETNANVNKWSTTAAVRIVCRNDPTANATLKLVIPAAVYTNRLEVQDLYIQSYDFRMVSNPSSLTDVLQR